MNVSACRNVNPKLISTEALSRTTKYKKELGNLARKMGIERRIAPHMLRHPVET